MRDMVERIGVSAERAGDVLFYVLHGGYVRRFHTMPSISENTVAAHSYGVAWLCWLLSNGMPSVNLLMAALAHDTPEQVWGDIPSPAKWHLGIKDNVSEAEDSMLKNNWCNFKLTPHEESVLHVADYLDGMLHCIHERALGNRYAEAALGRYRKALDSKIPVDMYQDPHFVSVLSTVMKLWEDACGNNDNKQP